MLLGLKFDFLLHSVWIELHFAQLWKFFLHNFYKFYMIWNDPCRRSNFTHCTESKLSILFELLFHSNYSVNQEMSFIGICCNHFLISYLNVNERYFYDCLYLQLRRRVSLTSTFFSAPGSRFDSDLYRNARVCPFLSKQTRGEICFDLSMVKLERGLGGDRFHHSTWCKSQNIQQRNRVNNLNIILERWNNAI